MMTKISPFFWLILFLTGCSLASPPAPTPLDGATPAGFGFLGVSGLPEGFDAQGHRGARALLPESTLPGFEAALDLGVTTLELDLHYTADGEIIVWHDPLIDKTKCRLPEDVATGDDTPDPRHPLRKIMVSQHPLATLQQYQCDLNPDAERFPEQLPLVMPLAGADYRIVTLAELFDFVDRYAQSAEKSDAQRENATLVHFNIETKRNVDNPEYIDDGFTGGEAGPFELAILELVASYGLEDRVVVQSFDHRSLQTIRAINSTIRLAALTTSGETKIKVYNGYQFDIWSPRARDLTPELLEEAQGLGLLVIPWTVNDPAEIGRLIEMGVDGLISDRPDLLLENRTQ